MRQRISMRQKVGIAVWGLLWLISAVALLRLFLEVSG